MLNSLSNKSIRMAEDYFHFYYIGYINARYKKDYVITGDKLTALIKRAQAMQQVVEEICREKIRALV